MPQDKAELTGPQRQLLFALMAEAREVSNTELDQACRLRLVGVNRRRLNELKLVTSEEEGRSFRHALTERGWRWCRDEFGSSPGERPQPWERVLYLMAAGLGRYLDDQQLTVDQVFARAQEPAPPQESTVDRVRRAYADLAAEPEGWVSLTDLRRRLDGLSRHELDRVLKDLDGHGVTLIPEANQKTLTADDRAAAVRIGGEDNHLLSMAE
jgi:hypothetical protein